MEIRIDTADPDGERDNGRHRQCGGDNGKNHHESGGMNQDIGEDDQHLGHDEQRDQIYEKFDPQKPGQRHWRRLDNPESTRFHAHGGIGEPACHGGQHEQGQAHVQKTDQVLEGEFPDRGFVQGQQTEIVDIDDDQGQDQEHLAPLGLVPHKRPDLADDQSHGRGWRPV